MANKKKAQSSPISISSVGERDEAVGKTPSTDQKDSIEHLKDSIKLEKKSAQPLEIFRPTADFTRQLATEIVKNLSNFGELTSRRFRREKTEKKPQPATDVGENPILLDTSVLIDGRIVPIVNSGFFAGTIILPKWVLEEVQHIADSADPIRRAKGRRGLDVANKLKSQKINVLVRSKVVSDDDPTIKEVDHKLVFFAKRWKARLLTIDFNLAQLARTQSVKVMNINDLAQAIKVAILPGEEITIKITHEGKEREQGVGYLEDGTMIVVDGARDNVGLSVVAIVTKVHQTPAGQLFFARLR